jgi:hypothetical protein
MHFLLNGKLHKEKHLVRPQLGEFLRKPVEHGAIIAEVINGLGEEGWEMVDGVGDSHTWYFKRPKG